MKYLSKILLLFIALFTFGCSYTLSKDQVFSPVEAKSKLSIPIDARLIKKSASLSIDVDSLEESTAQVYSIVDSINWYVESTINYSEGSANIVVKATSDQLDSVIEQLSRAIF